MEAESAQLREVDFVVSPNYVGFSSPKGWHIRGKGYPFVSESKHVDEIVEGCQHAFDNQFADDALTIIKDAKGRLIELEIKAMLMIDKGLISIRPKAKQYLAAIQKAIATVFDLIEGLERTAK